MHHIPVHPSRRALVTLIAVAVVLGMTSLAGTATKARNEMRLIPPRTTPATPPTPQSHPYLGMWVTQDGHIRHELLPSGRYDEQRGDRKRAYVGKYWVQGTESSTSTTPGLQRTANYAMASSITAGMRSGANPADAANRVSCCGGSHSAMRPEGRMALCAARLSAAGRAGCRRAAAQRLRHSVLLELTGLAGLALVFGMRHALDVDHLATIDGLTRSRVAQI